MDSLRVRSMDVMAFLRNGVLAGVESTSFAIDDRSSDSSSAFWSADDWRLMDSIIGFELPIALNHLLNIVHVNQFNVCFKALVARHIKLLEYFGNFGRRIKKKHFSKNWIKLARFIV